MKEFVLAFCTRYSVTLPHFDADNYRPVEPGTYNHRTLAYGDMREGITNGVICHMYSHIKERVVEVHLDNMDFAPESQATYHTKAKPAQTDNERSHKPRKQKQSTFDYSLIA